MISDLLKNLGPLADSAKRTGTYLGNKVNDTIDWLFPLDDVDKGK